MPASSPRASLRAATRGVVAACLLAVLATATGAPDVPGAAATELGNRISSGRRSQSYFESAMLAGDRAVAGIKAQTKETRRAYKHARRAVTRAKRSYRHAVAVVAERHHRLAELEALHADTPAEEIPQGYADRLRGVRREVAKAIRHRQSAGRASRIAHRNRHARQVRLHVLKRSLRAAISRREAAEGGLGAYIVEVTRLAQARAELQTSATVWGGTSMAWPSVGRIAQGYGCTGFYLNPRRGSCRHFHDGLDIVSGYGSTVRAAADGVVAFAGWNPWDEGGRAFVMVVSHPDGFVTRYGHMLPSSRARVGQFVRQGQGIGRMGNTGKSTGTHLHFEVLRGGSPVSPTAYLPAGMVEARPVKRPNRHKAGERRNHKSRGAKHTGAKGRAKRHASDRPAETGPEGTDDVSSSAAADVPSAAALAESAEACEPVVELPEDAGDVAGLPAAATGDDEADAPLEPGDATSGESTTECQTDADDDGLGGVSVATSRRVADATSRAAARVVGVTLPRRGTSPIPA